jgi:uncharacterized phage protein gp47/JayE
MEFKRMTEIYSRLVDYTITNTNEINDFSIGSAMRAIYEAISIEVESLYILTQENMSDAIEQGVYSSFGFAPKPAITAYGTVEITFNNATQQDMIISRGSTFSSSNPSYSQIYQTLQDYSIPKGSLLADITVYCKVTGAVGNIPVNTIDTMNSPIGNVKTVTNTQAFQTGQDQEPVAQLRARFQSYIASLSKATVPAIDYGTRSVPQVSGVYIDEETGLIKVYAHDNNGDLPSAVQTSIVSALENYRPAGIPVQVLPVTKTNVDVNVTVTLSNKNGITTAFQTQLVTTITNYLNNMQTGQDLVLSDLSSVIKYVDRQLIYDESFTTPTTNVIVQGSEIIRAGTITVTLQ